MTMATALYLLRKLDDPSPEAQRALLKLAHKYSVTTSKCSYATFKNLSWIKTLASVYLINEAAAKRFGKMIIQDARQRRSRNLLKVDLYINLHFQATDSIQELIERINDSAELSLYVDQHVRRALRSLGVEQHDCGHFHSEEFDTEHRHLHAFYNRDRQSMHRFCPNCQEERLIQRSDVGEVWLFSDPMSCFIERRHAVEATIDEYSTAWVDPTWNRIVPDSSMSTGYRHVNYDPNRHLIQGYHSSKGHFRQIHSDWTKMNKRFFGLELEVVVNSSAFKTSTKAAYINEAVNKTPMGRYCFFETDGSIGSNGFEIVTQPAGMDIHADMFKRILTKEFCEGVVSHDAGTCGLHIHVSRKGLLESQISRIQSFVNDVRNQGFIQKVARRYKSNHCTYEAGMAKLKPFPQTSGNRYEAINLQNRETIEFRMFKGTLRYESLMASLEFTNLLIEFCLPGKVSFTKFNAVGFKEFMYLEENLHQSAFLRQYLMWSDSIRLNEKLRAA